ncbi:MAG: hypothetical protein RLN70_09405 [Rhodospirillaceae bacterium]
MRKFLVGTALTAVLGTMSLPAHAYLDPGTASILLQSIIGGIAAGFAVISLNYNRLKSKISRWLNRAK